MDSNTFGVTARLETKLSGIYEILRKNERDISERINLYVKDHENNNAHQALLLHLGLNTCAILVLYHFFY